MHPTTPPTTGRLVDLDALEAVLTEQLGRHGAEAVFVALDERPRPEFTSREEVHLRAAELLRRTLAELNQMDPQNLDGLDGFYGGNNAGLVPVPQLSAYAHLRYALLLPLSALAGSRERGQELFEEVVDCDNPVAEVLSALRERWDGEDRARVEEEREVTVATEALLRSATTDDDYVVLSRLMLKAGLLWVCRNCEMEVSAPRATCDSCGTARPIGAPGN